jgi:AbrB family looped-hinge helix DNA binding protein
MRVRKIEKRKECTVIVTTISKNFQIVIPKEIREKLGLRSKQRLHVMEKSGVITLVPELPLVSLKGGLKGMSKTDVREKKGRS